MRRHPAKVRQKAASVFAPRAKLLLVVILAKMLRKINNFRVVSFGLGLKEVALSSIRQSDAFSNTTTRSI